MISFNEFKNLAKSIGSYRQASYELNETLQHDDDSYGIIGIEDLKANASLIPPEFFAPGGSDEWVTSLLSRVRQTPYSSLKSVAIKSSDTIVKKYNRLTKKLESANYAEEPVQVSAATIYTKNKIDRDDVLDITDFDVLEWLKTDMKHKLGEKIAAQILFGVDSEIEDSTILSVVKDSRNINVRFDESMPKMVADIRDGVLKLVAASSPEFWIRQDLYRAIMGQTNVPYTMSKKTLADHLGVSAIHIVPSEVFQYIDGIYGVILDPSDYRLGVPKGGDEQFFTDFDIDTNSNTVLLEKKICGMLSAAGKAVVIGEGGGPGPIVDADVYLTDAVKAAAMSFKDYYHDATAAICFNSIDTKGLTIADLGDLSIERMGNDSCLHIYAEWDFEWTTFSGIFEANTTDWGTIEGVATDEMGNEITLAINWAVGGTDAAIDECMDGGVYSFFQVTMPMLWRDDDHCNVICPGFLNLRNDHEYENEIGIFYDSAAYTEGELDYSFNQRLFATDGFVRAFRDYIKPISEGQTVLVPDLIVIGYVKKSTMGNNETLYWRLPYKSIHRSTNDIGEITFGYGYSNITIEASYAYDSQREENTDLIRSIRAMQLNFTDADGAWT